MGHPDAARACEVNPWGTTSRGHPHYKREDTGPRRGHLPMSHAGHSRGTRAKESSASVLGAPDACTGPTLPGSICAPGIAQHGARHTGGLRCMNALSHRRPLAHGPLLPEKPPPEG